MTEYCGQTTPSTKPVASSFWHKPAAQVLSLLDYFRPSNTKPSPRKAPSLHVPQKTPLLRHSIFGAALASLALCLLCVSSTAATAQTVAFTADLTPPSPSMTGPQVTTGPSGNAVNLGSVIVCPQTGVPNSSCTESQVLSYTVTAEGTLGTPIVVTEGISALDFNLIASSCTGPLQTGAQCQVTLTFTPTAPGLRRGAVEITDGNQHVITTTYLYGQGASSAIAFAPPPETNITTGDNHPQGVAVNAQGDVFYTDYVSGSVLKVPFNAVLSQTVVVSGFSNPSAIALDGAGNFYIADTGHNIVIKIPSIGGPGVPVGQNLTSPSGVAVDAVSNVFISMPSQNKVVKVPFDGSPQTFVGSGFSAPAGLSVDSAGNLFVADTGNGRVVKIPADGSSQTVVGGSFNGPLSVAVDAAGNLFVGDKGADGIIEVSSDGSLNFPLGNNFITPTGLALRSNGNLYVADLSRGEVVELTRTGLNLTFGSTSVGETSGAQYVRVQNIGNGPLFIQPSPTTPDPAFVIVKGPTFAPACTANLTVGVGSECLIGINFEPQSQGSFTSAYVLADFTLDTNETQTIGLFGTATGTSTQLQFFLPPSAQYGTLLQAMAFSNSPGAITYSVVSGPAIILSTGQISVTGEGLVTVLASQVASGNFAAATATASFQAVRTGSSTSITVTTIKAGFGTAARIAIVVHPDTSGVPTGKVNVFDGANLIGNVTLSHGSATFDTGQLTAGSHAFSVLYTGDPNFDISLSNAVTVVVASTTVKLTILDPTVPNVPILFEVRVTSTGDHEPHGLVSILDGGTVVQTLHLEAYTHGILLSEIYPALSKGTHVLSAMYAGDPRYPPGLSAPVTVTVK